MGLFALLIAACRLVALGCSIVVLIEMFRDEWWKGLVGLIFPLYFLYYSFVEFEHDLKGLVLLGVYGGSIGSIVLAVMSAHSAMPT